MEWIGIERMGEEDWLAMDTARMEGNYASVGQAFGVDQVIQGNLTLCKSIAETLQ